MVDSEHSDNPSTAAAAAGDCDSGPVQVTPDQLLYWGQVAKRLAREAGALVKSLQHDIQHQHTSDATADVNANTANNGHNQQQHGVTTDHNSTTTISTKSNVTDLVTRADIASQALIVGGLRADPRTHSHRIIGEEDAAGDDYAPLTDEPTWILDAIDGTTNFVHGLHDYAVSIALAVNRVVQIGAVYAPAVDEMFFATRRYGATLNDRRLCVRHLHDVGLQSALVVSEWAYVRDRKGVDEMLDVNKRILCAGTRGVRQLGSGALDMCYVAAARVNAVYCGALPDRRDAWKIWDYAAASLVAEEAGAVITCVDGSPFHVQADSMLTACSRTLADQLVAVIGSA